MEGILDWLQNATRTAALIGRQVALSLRHNWGIGLLSIVLALSLWVFVTDRENPDRQGRVPGTIPIEVVNLPPDRAVFPPLNTTVTVRARAAESVFERLSADDFRASVDLSDLTGEEATVSVRVESLEPRAEVIDVSPSQVRVMLESVTSRTVPVQTRLVGAPLAGFEVQEITVEPTQAVVTGPESLVARVEAVVADVNLTQERTTFEQTLLLDIRDEGGGNIQGVLVTPESAIVRAEIVQLEFSAVFVVHPNVVGAPADGYNVTSIQVDPPFVSVSGPRQVFQSIDAVEGIMTEPVDIDGARDVVVRPVSLRLPPDASADQLRVTVRVTIEATRSFSVAPQVINLRSGLSATLNPPNVQVVLAGALLDLSAIDAGEIRAEVDLGGLEPGEHTVLLRVELPAETALVFPIEARVTIR